MPPSPTSLRTLVLNSDGRPLTTWPLSLVSATDAILAFLKGNVTVIEEWDAEFRSPSTAIRVPKVVILRTYAHVHAEPKYCWRSVLLRDRNRCQYCGREFSPNELTREHVIPRAAGGTTTWDNVLAACQDCNGKKADRPANFSGRRGRDDLRPLKPPRAPTQGELLRSGMSRLDPEIVRDFGLYLGLAA